MAATGTEPTKIGRYEIECLVGEGAMAKVYRARDPEIDRVVAVKVLKDDLCVDEDYVNRFLREAKAAGAISHPNIVTVFDVGRFGNAPYITMEFLDESPGRCARRTGGNYRSNGWFRSAFNWRERLTCSIAGASFIAMLSPKILLLMEKGETVKLRFWDCAS
jgi:serine/threonine-protein kinase